MRRLHDALQSWEDAAIEHLLERPALHVDETGFRVDGKTQWLHVVTDGALTLKFVHPKRGGEAIEDIGIIPRYTGTLVHDCWGAYFVYDQCTHQLCGSHLLRELTFIVDSNGFRWARLMKKLLREACHRVYRSDAKTLTAAERRAVRKRYRTILTQGGKELPEIPPRPKGKRGRIAESDAHNLHERLLMHEESVLRFTADPDASFTNNAGEQKIQMSKVKIKVSDASGPNSRPSLVPDLQLSELNGGTRLQFSRHHPDRARRRCRRNDRAASGTDRARESVKRYEINE